MKKLFIMAAAVLSLAACIGNKTGYTVTVKVADVDPANNQVVLLDCDLRDTVAVAEIKDGVATFTGDAAKTAIAQVIYQKNNPVFALEPGEITVDLANDTVIGGPVDSKLKEFGKWELKLRDQFNAVYVDTVMTAEEKGAKMDEINAMHVDFTKKFVAENRDNAAGLYATWGIASELDKAELDSLIGDSEYLKGAKSIQHFIATAAAKAATAEGQKYTDFTIKGEDGAEVKLSDYMKEGKYLLVDFWASWCGPCRREIPVLQEIAKKHAKALNVVGVAVWDEPEHTQTAIDQLKIKWPVIFNAQKVPTDIYGISGIPHIMLIGPDGTILSRGLQGEDLRAKVDELLKK